MTTRSTSAATTARPAHRSHGNRDAPGRRDPRPRLGRHARARGRVAGTAPASRRRPRPVAARRAGAAAPGAPRALPRAAARLSVSDARFHVTPTSGAPCVSLRPPTAEAYGKLRYKKEPRASLSGHPRPRHTESSDTKRSPVRLSQATHGRGGRKAPIQKGAPCVSLGPPTAEADGKLR